MYPIPGNTTSLGLPSALALNALDLAALQSDHQPGCSHSVASALQGAKMTFRELAPDAKLKVAKHALTARDVEILRDADLYNAEQWRPTLAQATLVDQIDLLTNDLERMQAMNALLNRIQRAQPAPSSNRDAVLAHFVKKATDLFANPETFQLTRWDQPYVERDAALFAARIDLGGMHRTVLPLATEKAQPWFNEIGVCTQLRIEMLAFRSPVSPNRIKSILQQAKNDIFDAQRKSALLSDVISASRESMNSNAAYDTKDIFLDILSLLPGLPAKKRVTIMKELIRKRNVLPAVGRSDILETLMAMSKSLPREYQLSTVPLEGQTVPASQKMSAAVRVIEFAQCVSPEKWRTSLGRLIDMVPPHTKDRGHALARLAATCVDHAVAAQRNGGNPALLETNYLDEFKQIMTAVSTTVPPHHRFVALAALSASALPGPEHAKALQSCVKLAIRATARGTPQDTETALLTFWNVLSASAARR